MPTNGKMCKLIDFVCQLWVKHQTVLDSTPSQSISAIIGRECVGKVPFSLPVVSDCTVTVTVNVLFLASIHRGIPLDIIILFLKYLIMQILHQ